MKQNGNDDDKDNGDEGDDDEEEKEAAEEDNNIYIYMQKSEICQLFWRIQDSYSMSLLV